MRDYWIRDIENQLYFKIYWMKCTDDIDPNHGDHYVKHHSTIHHKGVIHRYVNDKISCMIATRLTRLVTTLRGCLDPHSSTDC